MPPTMDALCAALEMEYEQELWRSYVARMLWRMDGAWGGKGCATFEELLPWRKEEAITPEKAKENRRKIVSGINGR